jgi:pSer/pThr/pTyr-binding forkhead associated (FHA) protein
MITCGQYGRENEAFFKFCLGCGALLGQEAPKVTIAPKPAAEPEPAPAAGKASKAEARAPKAEARRARSTDSVTLVSPAAVDIEPDDSAEAQHAPVEAPGPAAVHAAPTPTERKCHVCGAAVLPDNRFCSNCGTQYDERRDTHPSQPVVDARADTRGAEVGRIVLVRPDQSDGASFALFAGSNSVGRKGTDIAFPDDDFLADHHLDIEVNDKNVTVRPHASLNGTFLRLRGSVELQHGDEVRIGQELLRIDLIDPAGSIPVPGPNGEETIGSPFAEGLWGRLCVLADTDRVASAHLLIGPSHLLGREQGDITFPHDGFVSGRHAMIQRSASGTVSFEDVGSRNGTYVRLKGAQSLQNGDFILAGQQLFRVTF